MPTTEYSGNIVDLHRRQIFEGIVVVNSGVITSITETGPENFDLPYLLPGFIDAHIHIESSMLTPAEFARLAVVHGTVATVSDPHEIANVCGIDGIRYMIADGKKQPFKFFFGASPCVPATSFETAGASISVQEIEELFQQDGLYYLSEMMNFPGVLSEDEEVLAKIAVAKKYGKPIDGHAPGLRGQDAKKYIEAGISTDHECYTLDEALDKLQYGMKIIIREGSAAKNYDALHPLFTTHPSELMFCSDDKHPDELIEGHIDQLVKRSLEHGYDLFEVLRCACVHPVNHYSLPVGLLREDDPADFITVNNLQDLKVLATFINGQQVAEKGNSLLQRVVSEEINYFNTSPKNVEDFAVPKEEGVLRVIDALDGQLITGERRLPPKVVDGYVTSDLENDILKICVVNRYKDAKPALGFIRNFGLKRGAIASSVAHDSHNIITIGVDDPSICRAVNAVIANHGGVSIVDASEATCLPLPIGGLMSNEDGYEVAKKYSAIDHQAKEHGSSLKAPFMTLSFMALLVIPQLKLSDWGLFDCASFSLTPLFHQEGGLPLEDMAQRIRATDPQDIKPIPRKPSSDSHTHKKQEYPER